MAGAGKGGVFNVWPDNAEYQASDFLAGGQGFGDGSEQGLVATEAAHFTQPQYAANAAQPGGKGKGSKAPTHPPSEGTTFEQPGQAMTKGGCSISRLPSPTTQTQTS